MDSTSSREGLWSVVVACPLIIEAAEVIGRSFSTGFMPNEKPDPEEVIRSLEGRDALILTVTLPITADFVDRIPGSVRALATYSVGHDHIALEACRERSLAVLNTPDVLTASVAEVAMLLLLGAARRVTESVALLQSNTWRGWQPTQLNGIELSGKTLGIFGMGRIGRAVAARARGFDMNIHYCNRRRLPPDLELGAVYRASADDLLAECDAVVFAAPATDGTQRLLDRDRIGRIKHGAVIVNIGRGNLIDDDALIEALADGRIGAAGLDVFNGEPAIDARYRSLPNVFATPHIGSSTVEARVRMAQCLVEGLLALSRGETPINRVA